MPRHVRQIHGWLKERSKSVNSIWKTRKEYAWKNSPPKSSTKPADPKKSCVAKVAPKHDYRKRSRCPITECFAVVKHVDQHLKNVHHIDKSSEEYKQLLQSAVVVRDAQEHLREKIQESRYLRRKVIRENCASWDKVPDFRETVDPQVPSYVAGSKKQFGTYVLGASGERCHNNVNVTISADKILKKIRTFMTSVDGGRLDAVTANSAVANIRNMMKSLHTD